MDMIQNFNDMTQDLTCKRCKKEIEQEVEKASSLITHNTTGESQFYLKEILTF